MRKFVLAAAMAGTLLPAAGLPAAAQAPADHGHSSAPASDGSLLLANGTAVTTLTFAELEAMPHIEVRVHNLHRQAEETYRGVPLSLLLARMGVPQGPALRGRALARAVVASAADGYRVVLSVAEADPALHAGQVIVADAMDGRPLGEDGALKLIVSEDRRPARWVRNLTGIAVVAVDPQGPQRRAPEGGPPQPGPPQAP